MKVVGIIGSPRIHGNTEIIVGEALKLIEAEGIETEMIRLADKEIKPCKGCYSCWEKKECSIKNDDFEPIFDKMVAADGIIVGTPVYVGSATSQTMALLTRAGQVARHRGMLLERKVGGPIVVARRTGHNFTLAQLLFWFLVYGMIVPGSDYFTICVAGTRGKKDILEDQLGVDTIKHFAQNMSWLMKKLHLKVEK